MKNNKDENGLEMIEEKLVLKPFQEADLVLFEKSSQDLEFRRGVGGDADSNPPTIEERRKKFEKHKNDPSRIDFAIWTKEGKLIGHCFLYNINKKDKRATLAIGIHDREFRGKGLGTEATKQLLKYAFDKLKLHRVDLRVLEYNRAAIRCYKKSGFKQEGIERESGFVDGKYYDDIRMSVLENEWQNLM
jgi:RimJ/RimL family protein N-acetyltransferase